MLSIYKVVSITTGERRTFALVSSFEYGDIVRIGRDTWRIIGLQ